MSAFDTERIAFLEDRERMLTAELDRLRPFQDVKNPEALLEAIGKLIEAAEAVAEFDWDFMASEGLINDDDAVCAASALGVVVKEARAEFGGSDGE